MGNRHTSFIRVLIALFYALFAFQAVAQSDRTVAEDSKAFVYEVERLENGTPAGRIPLDLAMREGSDRGQPPACGTGALAAPFHDIAAKVDAWIGAQS